MEANLADIKDFISVNFNGIPCVRTTRHHYDVGASLLGSSTDGKKGKLDTISWTRTVKAVLEFAEE